MLALRKLRIADIVEKFGCVGALAPFLVLCVVYILYTPSARADLNVTGDEEDKARNAYIDRFYKFTQDKNVMGNATTPDGTKVGGGRKTRFNSDDGLPFQSDLTYHDYAFESPDKVADPKNPKAEKDRVLPPFVSSHGKISGAGGSSLLERTVYKWHDQFRKQEEKDNASGKKPPQQKGVEYDSVYKIETREVLNDPNKEAKDLASKAGKLDPSKNKEEKDTVSRVELRPEARQEIDQVGVGSFDTLNRAAKDTGYENDENTMANPTLLYEAAGRATEALWDSTLANLTQRRAGKNLGYSPLSKTGSGVDLSQEQSSCEAWAANIQSQISKNVGKNGDPSQLKDLQKELAQVEKQCKTITSIPWNTINPRYTPSKADPNKLEYKTGDLKTEDSAERDLRNQLEIMNKAGKGVDELQSNWKYEQKDEETAIKQYDDNGQETGTKQETPKSQLNEYNKQVNDAADGVADVKSRFPGLQMDAEAIRGYQINPESRSMMEVNKAPASALDEFGNVKEDNTPSPQTYEQLQKKASKTNGK